jgi:hypothetical protein
VFIGDDQETIRTEKPRKLRENGDFAPAASQENPVSPLFIFGNNSPTRENAEKNWRNLAPKRNGRNTIIGKKSIRKTRSRQLGTPKPDEPKFRLLLLTCTYVPTRLSKLFLKSSRVTC